MSLVFVRVPFQHFTQNLNTPGCHLTQVYAKDHSFPQWIRAEGYDFVKMRYISARLKTNKINQIVMKMTLETVKLKGTLALSINYIPTCFNETV